MRSISARSTIKGRYWRKVEIQRTEVLLFSDYGAFSQAIGLLRTYLVFSKQNTATGEEISALRSDHSTNCTE